VGAVLTRGLQARDHEVVLLSRRGGPGVFEWDGRTLGPWTDALEDCDAVINLAGRSVDCRYTEENLRAMRDSRVLSTRVIGEAISRAESPPKVWLQMSTATIYAHTFGPANDEDTGRIGGDEPDAPEYWRRSIEIAKAWERALEDAVTPETRKVAMRTAMVMSPDRKSVFDVLSTLVRLRLGGAIAGGRQFVSWIHEADLVSAALFLLERSDFHGAVNLAAPGPLPQRDFMALLRKAWGVRLGLPAAKWMVELGAFFLRTDSELVIKSRRVVPGRLRAAGFEFAHPTWSEAVRDLVAKRREPAPQSARDCVGPELSKTPRSDLKPFSVRKPSSLEIRSFLRRQENRRLSYEGLCMTRPGGVPPSGYDVDRNRVRLGEGEGVFLSAAEALRTWTQFELGWAEVHPEGALASEGTTVAVLMRVLGVWWLNASRVVYREEETSGPLRRFGYAYGTLPSHVERGEERFCIEWHAGGDDSVWYEIHAFSRPKHPLARLGYPLVRWWQRRFVRDSMRVMAAAVAAPA
jgi:uncharacterized protein (TIGR01777 family)